MTVNWNVTIDRLRELQMKKDAFMSTQQALINPPKYIMTNQDSMLSLSTELTRFIIEKNLCTTIQGKQYVHVEGWQFAGAAVGLFAMLESLDDISTDVFFKYKAVAVIKDSSDRIISRGIAICTNKESKKRSFDEYAVASMAQTRAIGKAFRNILAWVMKAAGFEPTPSEEMNEENIDDGIVSAIAKKGIIIDEKKIVEEKSNKQKLLDRFKLIFNVDESQILYIFQKNTIEQLTDENWKELIEIGANLKKYKEDNSTALCQKEAFLLGIV